MREKKRELKARWGHWLCNETQWEMDPDAMGREWVEGASL